MNITVFNGSPKGAQSVTMQYAEYIQKKYPVHLYTVFNIASEIVSIEKNISRYEEIINAVRQSDGVLWAFPLYILHVHANYKRFIELLFERNSEPAFKGKYAAAISSSIKFFDNTAIDYIHAVSEDLGMQFSGYYAAAMDDLKQNAKRRTLELFAERFFKTIENRETVYRTYDRISHSPVSYQPAAGDHSLDLAGKKAVIITDELKEGSNLAKMIESFRSRFKQEVEIVNLSEENIKGGCLGCIRCGYDNTCAWEGKDGFIEMHKRLRTFDIVIFAGDIHDRYLSAKWKNFFDRGFYITHQPAFINKQWGFLISGPLRQCANLRSILQAWTEFQISGFAGVATDEGNDSSVIDSTITALARNALWGAEREYITTETFLRVGGMKIFRDEIFGHMRFVFTADHRFYKKHGYYDFPQKNIGMRIANVLLSLLGRIKPFRDRFFKQEIIPGMVAGHKKIVAQAGE